MDSKVTVIEVERYDWTRWPQSVCMRLQPTLKPRCFRANIVVAALPTTLHALRANAALTSHIESSYPASVGCFLPTGGV